MRRPDIVPSCSRMSLRVSDAQGVPRLRDNNRVTSVRSFSRDRRAARLFFIRPGCRRLFRRGLCRFCVFFFFFSLKKKESHVSMTPHIENGSSKRKCFCAAPMLCGGDAAKKPKERGKREQRACRCCRARFACGVLSVHTVLCVFFVRPLRARVSLSDRWLFSPHLASLWFMFVARKSSSCLVVAPPGSSSRFFP